VEKLSDIRPGMSVNLVMHIDIEKEITDVRNAIVYDTDGVNYILSQTNPPFTRYHVGEHITVTYLIKKKDNIRRIGFSGKVVNVLNDYALYSTETVQAVTVIRESDLKTYDLRMHYRVKPRSDNGIHLYVRDEKVNIIDISIGGARFCHSNNHHIEQGIIINMILTLDVHKFNLEAKAVDVWYPSEAERQADLEYVSVHFWKMDKKCSYLLGGKILAIQRELLSKT
jgi:hypothetical protein